MNKIPNRAQMRRENLRKKREPDTSALIGAGIGIASGGVGLLLVRTVTHGGPCAFLAILALAFSICGWYFFATSTKEADAIPYVPSVEEQLPNLPANEVLLRGSQSSTAAPEQLLRPAGNPGTPSVELLRPTSGAYDQQ